MPPAEIPNPTVALPNFLQMSGTISPESVIAVIITIVFIWWAIFTLVAAYHWFRYGRESWVAVPAMALHLVVSGWIFVFATGALH